MAQQIGRLSIRVDLGAGVRIGPGKIELLEAIERSGSIAGAGRHLKMSYKRAWDLIEELNRHFGEPLVSKAPGGANGGGAKLTPNGQALVAHYRHIERIAHEANHAPLTAIAALVAPSSEQGQGAPPAAQAIPRL